MRQVNQTARGVAVLTVLAWACGRARPAGAFQLGHPCGAASARVLACGGARAGCCRAPRLRRGALLAAAADGADSAPRPRPPETEAEKRELEALRRASAQAQEQPSAAAAEARARARALQDELAAKAGARRKIVDRARELLRKASADPRMAGAAADSAVDAVLAKNTQVAQLDADLARIAEELRALVPPGICALTAPSKMHGYVREMNAMPIIQALQQGNDRAQRIAALVIEADRELRFLTDQELRAIQAELAAGDSAEGALLRAAAARMMRDFQGTIVEGAKEAVAEEAPGALSRPGPLADARVAQAYWDELNHLLRLSHYAAAAAVASFAVPQVTKPKTLNPKPSRPAPPCMSITIKFPINFIFIALFLFLPLF